MKLFNNEHCHLFRLNWKHRHDPDALICAPGVLWSERRCLLYEVVLKEYHYYIFVNDDVRFETKIVEPLCKIISDWLTEYQPISGAFYRADWWRKISVTPEMADKKSTFIIQASDLQLTIYSNTLANTVFPVIIHGSDRCR